MPLFRESVCLTFAGTLALCHVGQAKIIPSRRKDDEIEEAQNATGFLDDEGVCVCENDGGSGFSFDIDYFDGEVLAVFLGIFTLFGTIVAYFIQRHIERKEQAKCDQKQADNEDRQLALERSREQLSVYAGPLHRFCKSQNTTPMQFLNANDVMFDTQHTEYWSHYLPKKLIDEVLDDPQSLRAKRYRRFVIHRVKPLYMETRRLHIRHSNLADMPSQEEYLKTWGDEAVRSPYVGSININVIFDTFVVWSYEFDDIIIGWENGDYSRVQPSTRVAWPIINYIADYLAENAKKKEARYNKHVKVHTNDLQDVEGDYVTSMAQNLRNLLSQNVRDVRDNLGLNNDSDGDSDGNGNDHGNGNGEPRNVLLRMEQQQH